MTEERPVPTSATPNGDRGVRDAPGKHDKRGRPDKAVFAHLSSPYFPALVALFIGVMLISNITGTKGCLLYTSDAADE